MNADTSFKIFTVLTAAFCFAMALSGLGDLFRLESLMVSMDRLGYPHYVLTIPGTCKLAGVLCLVLSGLLRVKEWASAGFVFDLGGGFLPQVFSGASIVQMTPPLAMLAHCLVSYRLQPKGRRL